MKTREYWLDYLRAFACILVTVGHLFMSFQEAGIIREDIVLPTFIELIYCFHVYIFFLCSGYLFQIQKNNSFFSRIEKGINFLCLYIIFSGITYGVKIIFSSAVNSAVSHSFWEVLLQYPINQMWYLYAIAIIFFFAKYIDSPKTAYILLGISVVLKILCVTGFSGILPLYYLFGNMIWFVIGQLMAYGQIKPGKIVSAICCIGFFVLFAVKKVFSFYFLDPVLTFLGVIASVGIVYHLTQNKTCVTRPWLYLSKYMLQIYLLHTICAAGIRAVLLKVGVSHALPHVVIGLLFSFVAPVICAIIAEKIAVLNVFFYPVKTIKSFYQKKRSRE